MKADENKQKEKEKEEYQINTELLEQQKKQLEKLLEKYRNIFVTKKSELGKCGIVKHRIDTGEEKPIRQRAYRASGKDKELIQEEIKKMQEKGVIEKSTSSWASPIVIVPKKNGERRFCIDLRRVNAITKRDEHPLPRIDDMLDTFDGSKYFSSLDMASGYWQIEIDERDKEKMAFITHEGLYQWKVMPFGLTNAPATFQRMMQEVLEELFYKNAPAYIDDINVHLETFEQHIKILEEVFERIRKAGLKLRIDKCKFCFNEIEFLGYIIGEDGIKTDEKKVEKVKNFPKPTTITELKGFLGLASYYRRFIKDFSKIAKSLNDLMKGINYEKGIKQKNQNKQIDITEKWKEKQEESF